MDVLNSVVDEVLKSVQQRLTNIEADVASLVGELNAVRQRLDETDAEVLEIRRAHNAAEQKMRRIERQTDAVDIPVKKK